MIFTRTIDRASTSESMTKEQLVSTSFSRDCRCYGPAKILRLYPCTKWLFRGKFLQRKFRHNLLISAESCLKNLSYQLKN